MKLSELVRLRNELRKTLDISIIQFEIKNNCTRLQNLKDDVDQDIQDKIFNLSETHLQHTDLLQKDVDQLNGLVEYVQSKIDNLSTKFFAENYQTELECRDFEVAKKIRQIVSDEEFESRLLQRINLYSNWQYPALEIGCRDGKWTKFLVASDPLYIADYFDEFIDSSIQQFPDLYQNRIRKYLIRNYYKIHNLPNNQFGLIFSYNFFNYLSLDSIKQFLIQSLVWLRPGGKIIFTYNNADLPAAAAYAENYFMTYVPKSMLVSMAESLGFEMIFSYDSEPAFSIIEFKKEGELKTIKAGQVLGEIRSKVN
jgi:SAM-dependent methyltransferase